MRKLNVFESISIDGFFTDAKDDMGWAHAAGSDPEFDDFTAQNASSGGDLLLGRKTYQMMESFWPTPKAAEQMPEVSKGMNAAKKYLVSKSLQPTWNNTQLLKGDLVTAVREIKKSDGPTITLLGSGSVVAQLDAAGLIDQYQFVIVPLALGAGRTLFTQGRKLRLTQQRAFSSGKVVVTYAT